MQKIFPPKLRPGDEVRVVAPSLSLSVLWKGTVPRAKKKLEDLGLKVTFGRRVMERDRFGSSSIRSRVQDLHDAFRNPRVKMILTAIGGDNSNQLLGYLDWDLIRLHPKIVCGFSDITALSDAIYAKTGLVTYSGPAFSSFSTKEPFLGYTIDYFLKCIGFDSPIVVKPSPYWYDEERKDGKSGRYRNPGWLVVQPGRASGTIIGGNLSTLKLLQGTPYFPSLKNSILFIEEAAWQSKAEPDPALVDRDLQSLLHNPQFRGVKALVLGRFQKVSGIAGKTLLAILKSKRELRGLPIIANVDFGHTNPRITFPVGGEARIDANNKNPLIIITRH